MRHCRKPTVCRPHRHWRLALLRPRSGRRNRPAPMHMLVVQARRHWRRLVAIGAGLALVASTAGIAVLEGPSYASSPSLTWTANSPDVVTVSNYLSGVTCPSSTECWAVGYYVDSSNAYQTLALEWSNGSWSQVATPDSGGASAYNELYGVTCVSSSDCWAVGWYDDSSSFSQTLALEWNGTSWSQVATPDPGGTSVDNYLRGVACASSSECWAVGYDYDYNNSHAYQTLALEWNGTSWSQVAIPDPGGTSANDFLYGVTCASSSECWAVGDYNDGSGYQTLAIEWNGTSWNLANTPNNQSGNNYLYGVTCASSSECWAVGDYYDSSNYLQTLALEWNGTSWAQATTPDPGGTSASNELYGVTCVSSSDCWAVGYYVDSSNADQTLALEWNGTSWAQSTTPDPGSNDFLYGVTCASSSDCWAVGAYDNSSGVQVSLAINGVGPSLSVPSSVSWSVTLDGQDQIPSTTITATITDPSSWTLTADLAQAPTDPSGQTLGAVTASCNGGPAVTLTVNTAVTVCTGTGNATPSIALSVFVASSAYAATYSTSIAWSLS